jgi:hypothetical protein
MENNNENTGSTNWTPPSGGMGGTAELDGANASQIMGIIGLVLSLCLGCGLVGFILSIIAFVKGKAAVAIYEANPSGYSEKSFKQAKTGKLLGLIGIILGIIVIALGIIYVAIVGIAGASGKFK